MNLHFDTHAYTRVGKDFTNDIEHEGTVEGIAKYHPFEGKTDNSDEDCLSN